MAALDDVPPCDCGASAWYRLRTRIIELETEMLALKAALQGIRLNLGHGKLDNVKALLAEALKTR